MVIKLYSDCFFNKFGDILQIYCMLYCVINFCRFANGGVKISIKFFSTDVVFFLVHPAVLKYQAKIDLLSFE